MADRPYSRVYWSIVDDPKFDSVYDNDAHLAAWLRLLLIADQAHPASAHIPTNVKRASVVHLAEVGLIDLGTGSRFRLHGLASERDMRSESARNAAASRWHSERNAKPMLDETRLDKTSNGARNASGPRPSSVDRDPHLREYRQALRALHGPGMDEQS